MWEGWWYTPAEISSPVNYVSCSCSHSTGQHYRQSVHPLVSSKYAQTSLGQDATHGLCLSRLGIKFAGVLAQLPDSLVHASTTNSCALKLGTESTVGVYCNRHLPQCCLKQSTLTCAALVLYCTSSCAVIRGALTNGLLA